MDSTSLGSAACILNYIRTTIGEPEQPELGAYRATPNSAIIYGVAVHKFVDVMYKTNGHYPSARAEAEKAFHVKKSSDDKKGWLDDPKHLITSCYNLWTSQIEGNESPFDVMMIPGDCWWCRGKGDHPVKEGLDDEGYSHHECTRCDGTGKAIIPATELTFRILFYEDDYITVYLCGTIDRVGKFHGGCYAIKDWKTTSAWNKDEYLSQYELSRQLRVYTLACKLMSVSNPDSILGKVGATRMGAAIDGVFLKSKVNDIEYQQSKVLQFGDEEMDKFHKMLVAYCEKISYHVHMNHFPQEGILNGSCDGKWGKCWQWNVCKSPKNVADVLLKRDFDRRMWNPLAFNE